MANPLINLLLKSMRLLCSWDDDDYDVILKVFDLENFIFIYKCTDWGLPTQRKPNNNEIRQAIQEHHEQARCSKNP
jgi:hypothetical protein